MRSGCGFSLRLADCREHLASVTQQHACILEVLFSQMRQHGDIKTVLAAVGSPMRCRTGAALQQCSVAYSVLAAFEADFLSGYLV